MSESSSRRESYTDQKVASTANLVDPPATSKTLNVITASIFIVGSMCGGGVLAIPKSFVDCGVIGTVVLVACGCISSFTGFLLGKCWAILRVRYPEYEHERITDPYPTIAFRAGGKAAKIATRVCIDITLFGGATVFLLLIAENISELRFGLANERFSLCYVMLIVTAALIPVTLLGTPKDFWQVAAVAATTSILAAIFVFASLIVAIPDHKNPKHSSTTWPGFFSAFGTILFAFGGASCFPTIQVDMEEPQKFPKSVVIGICTVMTVYLLVGIPGYVIVGDEMTPNVLKALPDNWISYTVNFLITFHLLMAFIIIINPVAQGIEGLLGVPDKLSWERVIVRTVLAGSAMFLGLTIPHFSVILSLLGGSTIALTNFIFPPLYYYRLSRQTDPTKAYGNLPSYIGNDAPISEIFSTQFVQEINAHHHWEQIDIPLHIKVLLFAIIMIGIVGGASSTYFSFASLINGQSGFTVPCYVNASVGMPS